MMNPEQHEMLMHGLFDELESEPRNLHQEATRLTKKKILLASIECFSEKGFQKTSLREIAKKAGVTVGAVYHHFQDKKDLLMKSNRAFQILSLESLRTAMDKYEDFFEALSAAFHTHLKMLMEDSNFRGIAREYLSMAMVDPDINKMNRQVDLEFREILESELARRHPDLPAKKRKSLMQMIFFAAEGVTACVVVDSPLASHAEQALDDLVETFRETLKIWKHGSITSPSVRERRLS
jgi:AcrR family transcriptional regulator